MSALRFITCDRRYCYNASWPSQFCLSVCPSDGWISQKRCKIGLPNFHHRLSGIL